MGRLAHAQRRAQEFEEKLQNLNQTPHQQWFQDQASHDIPRITNPHLHSLALAVQPIMLELTQTILEPVEERMRRFEDLTVAHDPDINSAQSSMPFLVFDYLLRQKDWYLASGCPKLLLTASSPA